MNMRTSFDSNGATSPSGKSAAEVLTFRAENECVRLGGNVNCHDDMVAATARVLKADPKLADAYYDDPRASFVESSR